MIKCEICGRKIHKKNRIYGQTVCSKHMHQLFEHGEVLDHNPRTNKDFNDFHYITKDTVEFFVYNIRSEIVGKFIIDAEDVNRIRWHKWRMDSNDRIVTGNSTNKNPRRELSRFILGVTDSGLVVDHIDGNPLNNKKNNLRICTQELNSLNKSYMSNNTSGVIGVSFDKHRDRWAPEIRAGLKRCYLGRYRTFEEAVYARYAAEKILFQEYQNETQAIMKEKITQSISIVRKKEIKGYVINKLQMKEMINVGYQLCGSSESAEQHSRGACSYETHL